MHAVKILFVFLLVICLLFQGSLNQEPRKEEGKLVFLSNTSSGILISNRKEGTINPQKDRSETCAYCSVEIQSEEAAPSMTPSVTFWERQSHTDTQIMGAGAGVGVR